MSVEMPIKAIAPWMGGKRLLAREIVAELEPHKQYYEPFCGGLAVLLAKPPALQETVSDLHGQLTNLAWCLADARLARRLYRRLRRTLFGEDLLREARERTLVAPVAQRPDEELAYWYFVRSWQARNGVAGTAEERQQTLALAVRFTAGGGSPTTRWASAVASLPAWHERLRKVVILRRDAFELLPKFADTPDLAIYADPPYLRATRTGYATTAGGRCRYEHEFQEGGLFGDEHGLLRQELGRFRRARVVVSYYDCPEVRQLYAGWRFVDVSRAKLLHAANGRGERRAEAAEVLIVNGPAGGSPKAEGRRQK